MEWDPATSPIERMHLVCMHEHRSKNTARISVSSAASQRQCMSITPRIPQRFLCPHQYLKRQCMSIALSSPQRKDPYIPISISTCHDHSLRILPYNVSEYVAPQRLAQTYSQARSSRGPTSRRTLPRPTDQRKKKNEEKRDLIGKCHCHCYKPTSNDHPKASSNHSSQQASK